jgi:hypothetical protein
MKTYPIQDNAGRLIALEVDVKYASVRTLSRLIADVSGVSKVRPRGPLSNAGDVRATFDYSGVECAIVEPFGDNSRYWIGPIAKSVAPDMLVIQNRIASYGPPLLRRIVADLVTLDFRSLFSR